MKKIFLLFLCSLNFGSLFAQSSTYWQQHVNYKMDVVMDVKRCDDGHWRIAMFDSAQSLVRTFK